MKTSPLSSKARSREPSVTNISYVTQGTSGTCGKAIVEKEI